MKTTFGDIYEGQLFGTRSRSDSKLVVWRKKSDNEANFVKGENRHLNGNEHDEVVQWLDDNGRATFEAGDEIEAL